jgi:hypothetical protein
MRLGARDVADYPRGRSKVEENGRFHGMNSHRFSTTSRPGKESAIHSPEALQLKVKYGQGLEVARKHGKENCSISHSSQVLNALA